MNFGPHGGVVVQLSVSLVGVRTTVQRDLTFHIFVIYGMSLARKLNVGILDPNTAVLLNLHLV